MLNFFKQKKTIDNIACPVCQMEHEISPGVLSLYCKNCRNRLDINEIRNNASKDLNTKRWKPKLKNISCPHCHSLQEVLSSAISAYCKNCNQRIPVKEDSKTDLNITSVNFSELREIICPNCGSNEKVPPTALSSFCRECGKRINLQNYEIRGKFNGDLDTKGTIFISNNGLVEGNINTGSLVIAGTFKGEIIAEDKIELKPSANLHGKIRASALVSTGGATLKGHLHIGREKQSLLNI